MGVRLKKKPRYPRFVKQKDQYSCGPVAILNIMKWFGYDITYDYLKKLKKYCKTTYDGTEDKNITNCLNRFSNMISLKPRKTKINELDNYLVQNFTAIVLMSKWNKDIPERHFFAIVDIKHKHGKTYYKTVNLHLDRTTWWVDREKLLKLFNRSLKGEQHPKIWYVRRKGESRDNMRVLW